MPLELVQIIDDEPDHAALLDQALQKVGYRTNVAHDGLEGLEAIRRLHPALALVDVMLPGADGYEICRQLRADPLTRHLPIIMITALGSEEHRVAGLTLGVDDYVTKPFSPREVVLRVGAILERRRPSDSCGESYIGGQLVHEQSLHHVSCCGRTVSLSHPEWRALRCLAKHVGNVVTREELIGQLWGHDGLNHERALANIIRTLADKLAGAGFHPDPIQLSPGVGYLLSFPLPPMAIDE